MMQDTYSICRDRLFDDEPDLSRDLPAAQVSRVLRIRSAYALWLSFPNKRDADIVQFLQTSAGIGKSAAYEDLRIVKNLLGSLNKASKDFYRWKFNRMFEESYTQARNLGDMGAIAKLQANYIKANRIDAEEAEENDWNKIEVQPFSPTTDPTILGIKPLPNVQEKIKKMREKYWNEDIETVTFEETEYNPDSLKRITPTPLNADGESGDQSTIL
jgi:hypothetical protein